MPISPNILLFFAVVDVILWLTLVPLPVTLPKSLALLNSLVRICYSVFYLLLATGIITQLNEVIFLGRTITFFLFYTEIVSIILVYLGYRHDHNSK